MKNLWLILIIMASSTVWAQQDKYLEKLKEKRAKAISTTPQFKNLSMPTSINKITTEENGVEDLTCRSKQKSVPLSYLSGMLMNTGENFKLDYDQDRRSLRFDFGEMMTGCNDQYNFVKKSVGDKYYIELRLKDGVSFEDFQKCTSEKDFVTERVVVNFKDVQPNQEIVFLSNGPYASKYQRHKLIKIDGCQVTEQIDNHKIVALEKDEEYLSKQQKAAAICESGNLDEIMGNLALLEELGIDVQKITDGLHDQKVIEAADKIRSKDLSGIDFEVFSDFEKYVIDPKVAEIEKVFSQLMLLEVNSSAYDKKKRELDALKRDLAKYSREPYPGSKVRSALLAEGYFSEEALIFKINTKIATTRMIFNKQDGQVIDPAGAQDILNSQIASHNSFLDQSRKEHRIRKGEITGESDKYFDIASSFQRQLEDETQGYQEGMTLLNRKMQECGQEASGFFGYNQKKHQQCIESKQRFMDQFKKIYAQNREGLQKEIDTYLEQGDHYAALEAEARGEVPSQGDDVRPSDKGPRYTFDYKAMLAENMPAESANPAQQQPTWNQGQQMRVSPQYQNPAANQYNPQYQSAGWPPITNPNYQRQQNGQYYQNNFMQQPQQGAYSFNYNGGARQPAQFNQYQQNPLYNPQINGNYYQQYHQYNRSIPSQMYNGPTQQRFSTPSINPGNINPYHGLPPGYNQMTIRNT